MKQSLNAYRGTFVAVTDDDFGDDDLFELPDIESHNDELKEDDLLRVDPVETNMKDEDDLSRLDPDEPGEIPEEEEEKVLEINGKIIAIIAGVAIGAVCATVAFTVTYTGIHLEKAKQHIEQRNDVAKLQIGINGQK